jgi:chromosome segregation ATPase
MDSKIWFYDDREYYNYVLLNSSEEVYTKIQQALRANKVRVLKASASFRPASNGIQYKWYIRIEGENFKPPTQEQIKSIVESVLTPEVKVVSEQSPVALQAKINSLNLDVKKLQSEAVQKNKEIENAKRLYELEIKNLQSNLSSAKSELEQNAQTVNELRQQIKDSFNLDDVASLENQYKAQVKEIELQLQNAKQELKDYIDNFQGELNRRDIEIASLIKERDGYISEIQSNQESIATRARDDSQSLFFSAVNALLPNVEFLRSSLDFVWNNFSNQEIENIFKAIKLMDSPNMRAEKVESTSGWGWKEYHPERVDWRIYFRQCKNKQYQVLISDKDTQEKRDWDWLKNQPKNC